MLTTIPAFAVTCTKDYGEDGENHNTRIIGVAVNHDDAITILTDAWTDEKAAFINTMRNSPHMAYKTINGEKVEDFIELDNLEYRRISMYVPDEVAPFMESVSCCIEEIVLYKSEPEVTDNTSRYPNTEMVCDERTGIRYMSGKYSLKSLGFAITGKLLTAQNRKVYFWKNQSTGEVAISVNQPNEPVKIFANRIYGNRWFKSHITPMPGHSIISINKKSNSTR